jgi:hypothetical protein
MSSSVRFDQRDHLAARELFEEGLQESLALYREHGLKDRSPGR